MPKTLISAFCVIILEVAICFPSKAQGTNREINTLDTSKLNKLIFDVNRKAVANHLSNYINSQPNPNVEELALTWLELAIFNAWPVDMEPNHDIQLAKDAFNRYTNLAAGKPESRVTKSNRLLFKAFVLSSVSS